MDQCTINELFRDITVKNDQAAFKAFYNHFFVKLLRFSYTLTRSKEVAEEITNDVFMHCWQKRQSLTDIKNPQVYLFVVAKNRAIDHMRKQAASRQVAFSETDKLEIAFDSDPEQLMISAEMIRKMEFTIQQLPPKCKMVYVMVKQYGLKYKEVATLLNLSVKTVENQLAIAIKRLTQAVNFTLEKPLEKSA
ncbi:RNA polymerase sigma-70 factor [Chitinophaga nivalis]|uniref:RNA polymerase sigma-70 factor n=1 Tax=Chitinophaga nivalis TaxID=2991709 RepID=A0ABT3IEN0_9BACT|nr:RNA polymerase sigma-70 factor [Chitinophaga nivalis]MCW3467894.1 RNA polymerase sigma-70 factor [Chitinophaga nivalis]MCW3482415.1 RNA polymerase sigma-70 factor [Chitinophaga nivalis]